ncbi:uncharacterized protein LOC114358729 [Ostrinia furnacalis]|uniref:uncharacterized protein LOC114358729 n=1 Tax=Ostrinia furnacalis TaxID=93504 RepID=UPI00103D2998|nr:uncharacterized protein LOC114358729 [Ostrinia furnacalis]
MDRFVVREPRIGADFPQANQVIGFESNSLPRNNNTMIPQESMYLGGYGREYPIQHMPSPGYFAVHQQMGSNNFQLQPTHLHPVQAQMMSGIDPRYLAGYSDGNAATFIATGQQAQTERQPTIPNFGGDYENRSFVAPDRSKQKMFVAQAQATVPQIHKVANKTVNESIAKEESSNKILTRSEKLQALYKSGPRAFSGPVEKVLKWHKALQEIGLLVIYEIVAKCVSVRAGESCAKTLVVRDDSGPAMQVVYYEIDFLLPELKPPCTVRVIGRMMAGTCRLQAFSVRSATGDDVAALPRRAAVAAHHVAKICKDYGIHV